MKHAQHSFPIWKILLVFFVAIAAGLAIGYFATMDSPFGPVLGIAGGAVLGLALALILSHRAKNSSS